MAYEQLCTRWNREEAEVRDGYGMPQHTFSSTPGNSLEGVLACEHETAEASTFGRLACHHQEHLQTAGQSLHRPGVPDHMLPSLITLC